MTPDPNRTDVEQLAARIRNAAFWVRHYKRGRSSRINQAQRAHAIRMLGLAVRHAFDVSDDFETLLIALVEALAPPDYLPPF